MFGMNLLRWNSELVCDYFSHFERCFWFYSWPAQSYEVFIRKSVKILPRNDCFFMGDDLLEG